MTITEAGACGTPAVATRIAGHADAIDHGRSGLLVDDPAAIAPALSGLLADPARLAELALGARAHAAGFTWEATASGTLKTLVEEACKRKVHR
jgi:glycosyltransferase involved in cell wall biosynthesis